MAKAKSITPTDEQTNLIALWMDADKQLATFKAKEFELRQRIVNELGFDPKKLEGTETLNIGNGWKLKVQKTQNYSLTNTNGETVALLNVLGAKNPELAQALVNWKPELSKTAYKQVLEAFDTINKDLPEDQRVDFLLAKALTIKPGTPQVDLVPPDAKEPQ